MKLSKRSLALLLAASLTLSLAACGGPAASSAPSSTAPSTSASSGAAADPAAPAGNGKQLWFDEELVVTMMMSESNQQKMALDAPVIKAIKAATNATINLQPIPEADFVAKCSTVLASNKMPDIMCNVGSNDLFKYAPTGMFASLSDYSAEAKDYLDIVGADNRKIESKKYEIDGKIYSFRALEHYRVPVAPLGQLRADLLEEQSIPMPTTWDELYEAMVKIKAKHPDMVGFSSRNGTNYLIGQLAYSMGSGGYQGFSKERGMYYEPSDDKYIYAPTDARFTGVIEYLNKCYKAGLLDPDYATMNKDKMFEKLSSGKMMFVYDNCSFTGRIYNPALKGISESARFDLVPPLKNATGSTRAYRYELDWTKHYVINSQSKRVGDIVKLFNWMYTDEGRMITNFGVEGEHYNLTDGAPTIVDSIVEKTKDAPDHFVGIQAELGAGLLAFAPYVDETTHRQISDPIFIEFGDRIQKYTDAGQMQYMPTYPNFTQEETTKIVNIEQKLLNTFNQEIDAFITGKKPMAEWANVVKTLQSQGSAELETIFNTAYSRLK